MEQRPMPLGHMEIVAGLDERHLALLESILEERRFQAGETIIHEGAAADAVYLLAEGLVSVWLRLKNGAGQRRLSTLVPGLAFGELALLDGGRRSADVIADEPALCYVIPIAKLIALAAAYPEIRTQLIINIGRELSARLRHADAEIRSLAE
jgi:glutaminase